MVQSANNDNDSGPHIHLAVPEPEARGERRRRLNILPARSLAPNILTILALCAGLTAVRYSLQERWEFAVLAVVLAGLFDGLDGRVARLLKGTSRFGAELDSLSDIVGFGVAPAVLLYTWTLNDLGGLGWILSLAYCVCCALRLARFNTASMEPSDNTAGWMGKFFVGVPAPAAAGLAMFPMTIHFLSGAEILRHPLLCGVYLAVVAFLMVSRLPTFSFKRVAIRREAVLPILLFVGLFTAVLTSYPWGTLAALQGLYLVSIPISYEIARRHKKAAAINSEETPV